MVSVETAVVVTATAAVVMETVAAADSEKAAVVDSVTVVEEMAKAVDLALGAVAMVAAD